MSVRTRFAPSPTGRLHLGHVLAARVAHSLAHESVGGKFFLRHEDIDAPRVREEFYASIEEDLRWLGLDWDGEPLRQATRTAAYEAALEQLKQRGVVYPCFCTRREIQEEWARMGAAPHGAGEAVYPRTCRDFSGNFRDEILQSGRPHAWRLDAKMAAAISGPLSFRDLRHGEIAVNADLLGDVVLARKDIGVAYHLAVVVDDAFQEITQVTRGEDLLVSTHVHRLLQALLGLPEPQYFHHSLVLDEVGNRLAKRSDALSVRALRAVGKSAAEVLAMVPLDGEIP